MKISGGLHVLRLALAAVFLWFGFSQLLDSVTWVTYVPDWAVNMMHLPPAMIVIGNGLTEIILGGMLAMGIFTRTVAILLGLHLFVIAFDLGFTALGIRDFGLACATIALALLTHEHKHIEAIQPISTTGA